jgi:hypothetical protein
VQVRGKAPLTPKSQAKPKGSNMNNNNKSPDMNRYAKREIELKLRVNPHELEMIKRRQNANTMGRWLRDLALKSMPIAKTDPNLIRQLGRIGSNLNQITKHANIDKALDQQVLNEITAIRGFLHTLIENNLRDAEIERLKDDS